MARRRRKHLRAESVELPALTGVALLLSETPVDTLDLHGYTAVQAQARLLDFLRTRSADSTGGVIHVITGRGNRSEGAPVLPGLVRSLLGSDGSGYVRESAGLPGGGGVAVRLR